MDIREAVYKELKGTSAVTALVGTRIYPVVIPERATLPAVSINVISTGQTHTMGSDSGPYNPLVQISVYGATPDDSYAVTTVIKTALKDFSGTLGGDGGLTVQRAFLDDEGDLYDQQLNRAGIYLDFTIWHE